MQYHPKRQRTLTRVKINTIQLKETQEEQKKTEDSVFEQRPYIIDAAIVRIMKSKKKARHGELFNELFTDMRRICQIDIAQMKERIETLIEREYIERDAKDHDTYVYVA